MKQYYKCVRKYEDGELTIHYWHGDSSKEGSVDHLHYCYDFVIPLGTHKPKNVSRETIKEF